ncbi:MAG: PD-(D/E)XK nuclease family protein, partial [Acidimicrobiia bacterium]
VSGRADVIIHAANGEPERLSIVDYNTAADGHDSHDFQLQVYTDAGRKEGLTVEGAFVHDLKNAKRLTVPVEDSDVGAAEERVKTLVGGLRGKEYIPNPGERCTPCDVRAFCKHRAN